MRNDLDSFAEVFALALVVEHGLVHLAAGEVIEPRQLAIGKAFVMAKVEIGFGPIIQHIDFAMLVRIHGARIDVEIRIELLQGDLQTTIFQQRAERSCS